MIPDFSKNTIDILAKRAAYKCSNPDCRVNTVGPNSSPNHSIIIGEAAHIYGARIGSKRFDPNMTDTARAEITNSVWLCRNCHKLIDTDEQRYSTNVLFTWREKHEEFIAATLGNNTDQIVYNDQVSILSDFHYYPPIIKRIIIDKPDGWEYRLTAELMRFLNEPIFRKLQDLNDGLYLKKIETIEFNNSLSWIQERITEMGRVIPPAVGLFDSLVKSWGKPGEPGDVKEIHHITKLIKDYLEHVLSFEERIHFVNVPEEYERSIDLLKNTIGSQVKKIASIPKDLDEVAILCSQQSLQETPKTIIKEIVFELPENWENEFRKEFNKIRSIYYDNIPQSPQKKSHGCLNTILIIAGVLILLSLIL